MTDTSPSAYRWQPPTAAEERPPLRILNSFTRRKELFIANDGRTVRWYSCGPTVYDVSHLGHARCYITFDIIRRILADYFGYRVFYVMNITDIDDKIIKRARSNHLCDKYIMQVLSGAISKDDLMSYVKTSIDNYQLRRKAENDPAKLEMIKNVIKTSDAASKKIEQVLTKKADNFKALKEPLEQLRDVLADEQDHEFGQTLTDHQIFKSLTSKFEQEFHDDMKLLGVRPPNATPRVSEYIDKVGVYIKKLEENGYAYRSAGSVYFDTEKFDSNALHSYAKLARENYGQKKSLDEGEGELSGVQQEKRSPNDFALWKRSKPGEPSWTTEDYEAGRPGWHIECSVMASDLLGENFDMHSGGCDLKFPHHDNEIAQAEAYYNTGKNWVNYFIHSGHLTISGCKMSKSLKNFVTIRQALKDYTARQLRFLFLAHGWAETLDYSPDTLRTAKGYEKKFKEFFQNVQDSIRQRLNEASNSGNNPATCELFQPWTDEDRSLEREFSSAIKKVDSALADSFDTRLVLNCLCTVMKECNKRPKAALVLVGEIALFVGRILNVFGAGFEEYDSIAEALQQSSAKSSKPATTDNVAKYIEPGAELRAGFRRILVKKPRPLSDHDKEMLQLCDTMRDKMSTLGVKLEDGDGSTFKLKLS